MAFNAAEPVLIVGDSKGRVHSFKLSPNLRVRTKEASSAIARGEPKEFMELEVLKMKKILEQVVSLPDNNRTQTI